jgi:predicted GNAT superfamily acetyltransferase
LHEVKKGNARVPKASPSRRHLEFQIRTLDGLRDFQQAEQVQREAWGFNELDILPASIFSVARNFGGQAFGAFLADRLVGFALSFGAIAEGHAHLHSHMVAVVPEFQNCGLGRKIKLAQREDALLRGIDQIVWTFDPLQHRNAYFNFARLGGIGVRYLPNLYGESSSPLHGGIPTDRLVVAWNLKSERVEHALSKAKRVRPPSAIMIEVPSASVELPREVRLAGQAKLRNQLTDPLQRGYIITGFESTEAGAHYILEQE